MKQSEIYKKLKQIRKERGLTLATLATKIGSDYQSLSRIERGKSRLTVELLMKMAEAFETPIDELINPSKTQAPPSLPTNAAKLSEEKLSEDRLGEILEKLEALLHETQSSMAPQTKAAVTSLLYKEAHNSQTIDFAMKLLKAAFH